MTSQPTVTHSTNEREVTVVGYDAVAAEYYDPIRHPTCANFRRGSERILSRWLEGPDTRILEIGCGRSLVAEILLAKGTSLTNLTLVDSSVAMLNYSAVFARAGATLVNCDAEQLAILDQSADVVVASLGDPFNTPPFWTHVQRIMRRGGRVLFTTPSFEWSSGFRFEMSQPADLAEFVTRDGSSVFVPSFVYSEREQVEVLARAGLTVRAVDHATIADLGIVHLSPKLRAQRDGGAIVTGYLCTTYWPPE
jgi:ubiquinone/menaquinone biosynthesis C-methylase UbiE